MSTPTSLDLPDGVRRVTIDTDRGWFAALEALPAAGLCERDTALLVPGYTGSKEDFLAILDQLADHGRRVVAIDMRGQFETPGTDDPDGYSAAALGADIVAVLTAIGARHLLGHSYGGLIAREALLTGTASAGPGLADTGPDSIESLTLMSSGPGALDGPRAGELRDMLAALGVRDGHIPPKAALQAGMARLWQTYVEPQAAATGVPKPIVAFLGRRMLSNDPSGLVLMARHMLAAPDRTTELARLAWPPVLVLYGENDNSWSPAAQEDMARRLGANRVCIPGAAHSPAVEAPATTASALTRFWDTAEATTAAAGRRLPRAFEAPGYRRERVSPVAAAPAGRLPVVARDHLAAGACPMDLRTDPGVAGPRPTRRPPAVIPRRVSTALAPPSIRRECRDHVARTTWWRHPHRIGRPASRACCGSCDVPPLASRLVRTGSARGRCSTGHAL